MSVCVELLGTVVGQTVASPSQTAHFQPHFNPHIHHVTADLLTDTWFTIALQILLQMLTWHKPLMEVLLALAMMAVLKYLCFAKAMD